MLEGRATETGTARYASRFAGTVAAEHFRRDDGLTLSSIGLGTYLGDETAEDDRAYEDAVTAALGRGANVLDAAINYRCQRSERTIGRALAALVAGGGVARDEIFVSTKGGYLPFDGDPPPNPHAAGRHLRETYVDSGIAARDEIVDGIHCLAPRYLRDQIARSRRNLGLATIDLYYLHNPEHQLGKVAPDEFLGRVRRAFEMLEEEVAVGRVARYGMATWSGFRVEAGAREHLSLEKIVTIAREVGGSRHGFRAVQLPLNLAMTEALTARNQSLAARGEELAPLLEVAGELGVSVFASGSILQGRLASGLPALLVETFPGLASDAQRALQFTRSTPGITSALVGMKQRRHVDENLALAAHPPASLEDLLRLFETDRSETTA